MPTPAEVHVDGLMTDISIRYANAAFLAPLLFPLKKVQKRSDKYVRYGKERFQLVDDRRAPGTEPSKAKLARSFASYECEGFAVATDYTYEERDNEDDPINVETDAAEFVAELAHIAWEKRVRDKLMDTSVWADGSAGTAWTAEGGDPIANILTGIEAVKYANVNAIVMGKADWNAFQRSPAVWDYLGANERKVITTEVAAAITGIPNWYIGEAFWNTAKRGKTEIMERIWGGNVWLGHIEPNPGRNTVTAGVTLRWQDFETVKRDDPWAKRVDVGLYYDQAEHVVCSDVGYIITGTTS